ncbi:MAG TPA: hypothetical protein VK176_00760 [Phycisphaerales bacterium]|nr:hypothetical protein [Phycisphaerales bacterium]
MPSTQALRRAATAGRLLACSALLIAAAIMLRVGREPSILGTGAAITLLLTVFLAFLADRFLTSVLDRVDRFDVHQPAATVPQDSPADLKDAA